MSSNPLLDQGPAVRASGQTLKDYLRLLWTRKWVVLLVAVVVVGGIEALTLRQDPVYQASVRVTIPPPTPLISNGILQPQQRAQNFDAQEAQIIASPVIASRVIEALGLQQDSHVLARRIHVEVLPETDIVRIFISASNPQEAARIANAVAQQYLGYRRDHDTQVIDAAIENIDRSIEDDRTEIKRLQADLGDPPDPAISAQINSLNAHINQLLTRQSDLRAARRTVGQGQILDQAVPPKNPVSPDRIRNGVLGVILGLILGAAAAFILEYFRDKLASPDEVERLIGAPVLALVPDVGRGSRQEALLGSDAASGPLTESFRTLRTNLQFIAKREHVKTLVVTSPSQGDGKTVTASNLAIALTQTGNRVVLIDGDLRRPQIGKMFGVSREVGLSSVLMGEASVDQAATRVDVPNLRVIGSGPIPAQPTELLGGPAMPEVLEACHRVADFVVIDSPPAVGLADPSVLATYADGVLLVLSQEAGRRVLRQTRAQLDRVGARVLGVVVNKVQASRRGYYYYDTYYPYYRYEYAESNGGRKQRVKRR